jgi:hypothetical protein
MIAGQGGVPEVVRSGLLLHGRTLAEYYTSQPAPTQWLAIGVVSTYPEDPGDDRSKQMLVGAGRTEIAAVASLWDRLMTLATGQPAAATPAVQSSGTDSESPQPDGKLVNPVPRLVQREPVLQLD